MIHKKDILGGHCRDLGATIEKHGVNFAIWCRNAKVMELLLFKDVNDDEPQVIELTAAKHRSSYYWHVFIRGLKDGQHYGWRVKEVLHNRPGMLFDPQKVLLDPYGKRIVFPDNYNRTFNQFVGSNVMFCAKNVVVDMNRYNWNNDESLNTEQTSSVIYEMHVAGFTKDRSSGLPDKIRGTYRGVIEKIPYLKELGVNAVELLPVFQFDRFDASPGKNNYWGYSPMGFFAIHGEYSSRRDVYGPLDEFRDMVKALHKAGIEVILDVVYNHTSEGGDTGPIYSFKGLDNNAYYILDEGQRYKNYSGCGNTLNSSHPMVKRMILDSLHFWTEEMHVDGFRFDLASILSRATSGEPLNDPPTTLFIATDPRLAKIKLIAEPWDAGGLYQVGRMAGKKWREWNGQFRDDVRCFIRGDENMIHRLVNRLLGSPDIYRNIDDDPQKSINFITCHDGFTLWDLVCYNQKHNEANGEHNNDGNNCNFSSNYGVEGETDDKEITALRMRQVKNMMLLTMYAMGTPMILMGDEVLRTQLGNNNAYCQDNEISYLNWNRSKRAEEMFQFTRKLIANRVNRGSSMDKDKLSIRNLAEAIEKNQVTWHGVEPYQPDWSPTSHSIGMCVYSESSDSYYYMFINSYWEGLHIKIPNVPSNHNLKWLRIVDTSLPSPDDFRNDPKQMERIGHFYYVASHTILVLVSEKKAPVEENAEEEEAEEV